MRFDKAARALATATDEFCTASVDQSQALSDAGLRPADHGIGKPFSPWMLEAALRTALDARPGVRRVFELRWSYIAVNFRRPLAELVGRPVEPK